MPSSPIPRLSLAIAGRHAIFLHVAADRYFALPHDINLTLLALLDDQPTEASSRQHITEATGLPATASFLRALFPTMPPPVVSASASVEPPPPGFVLAALRHLLVAFTRLRLRGLKASLDHLSQRTTPGQHRGKVIEEITDAHAWLSQHLTAKDACLLRSLALAEHARATDCDVQLVIGVKADPFAAHCWVQCGGRILNDDVEQVAAFCPIVVA